jgi:hypothetical protein
MQWKVRDTTKCISSTSETFINYVISFVGPSFFGEAFYCSQGLRASILKDNDWILSFSSYNTFGPLAPSSHEMRYNPFLGSMNLRNPKDEETGGNK